MRLALLFFLTYLVGLVSLLDYQSLWVDELMQLVGTRSGTLANTEQLTRSGVGGVPLGWLPQLLAIQVFGYSTAIARLPSALAGVAASVTVFFTSRELGMRYPLLAAVLFSLLPLQFRYALEGRPYAQGVFLSALATLLFIKLVKRQSFGLLAAYALVLGLGVYTQPFAGFTACAHFVWTLTTAPRQNRLIYFSASAIGLMLLTFLPWYVYASPLWQQTIQAGGFALHLSWKTPLMLIREISGAGYIGGCSLLLLAAAGLYKGSTDAAMKRLLVLCTAVPVICVLAADAIFSYFLAIRQMIFILPPLVLLAADGLFALTHSSLWRRVALSAFLVLVFLIADRNWLQKPRENWEAAARAIQKLRLEYSACTLYTLHDTVPYYAFFEPQLLASVCSPNPTAEDTIVLVTPPYSGEPERAAVEQLLMGKSVVASQSIGMSTIEVFR